MALGRTIRLHCSYRKPYILYEKTKLSNSHISEINATTSSEGPELGGIEVDGAVHRIPTMSDDSSSAVERFCLRQHP